MNIYREQIKNILSSTPTQYVHVIKKYPILWKWVESTIKIIATDSEKLYLSINPNCSPVCQKYGTRKKFKGFTQGFVCPSSCLCVYETKQKSFKKTSLKMYGVDHPMKSSNCKENRRKTTQIKYAVDNVFQDQDIKQKRKDTLLSKYGTTSLFLVPSIKEKFIRTSIKNWGFDHPAKSERFQTILKQRMIKKYGVANYSLFGVPLETYEFVNNKEKFSDGLLKYGVKELAERLQVGATFILKRHKNFGLKIIKAKNKSSYELEIATFLQESNFIIKTSDRTQIKPYELDFYLPDHKIAIEFQGDYWHMNPEIYDPMDYNPSKHAFAHEIWEKDKIKENLCYEKDIFLIKIWEADWNYYKDNIKDYLLSLQTSNYNY